jgi:hypothetical protein
MLGGVLTAQNGKEAAFGGPGAWRSRHRTLRTRWSTGPSSRQAVCVCVFAPAGLERRSEHMLANKQANHHPSGRPSNGKPA